MQVYPFDYATLGSAAPYTSLSDYSTLSGNSTERSISSQKAEMENILNQIHGREQGAYIVSLANRDTQSYVNSMLTGETPEINRVINNRTATINGLLQNARAGPISALGGGGTNINSMLAGGAFSFSHLMQNRAIASYIQNSVSQQGQTSNSEPINTKAVMEQVRGSPVAELSGSSVNMNYLLSTGTFNTVA